MSTPVVDIWGPLFSPARSPYPPAPEPHDQWALAGGTAWVYYSPLNRRQLVKPIILADGFSGGASNLDQLWLGLEENGDFRFVTELHATGHDLIILGFDDRAASITDNANTAIECIRQANNDRVVSEAKLTVGGFSMGGLVTRFALAKMEHDADLPDHETGVYLSYDTPHNGAWTPISLQAFVRFAADTWGDVPIVGPYLRQFSELLNSPAARQMARWHIENVGDIADQAPERVTFLAALEEVGGWPQNVRKIGVANGVNTGVGNGIRAGVTAVSCDGETLHDTWLNTQAQGEQVVASLQKVGGERIHVRTSGLPDIDGAPGGLFAAIPTPFGNFGSFGLAAMLMSFLGNAVDPNYIDTSCFIPSVSAVAAGDIDTSEGLYRPIAPDDSALDAFQCASQNEGHTTMTKELGEWIVREISAE